MMQSKSPSSSSVPHRLSVIIVAEVRSVRIDLRRVVVAAQHDYRRTAQRTSKRVFVRVHIVGIARKRTASVGLLVGDLLDLLAHEVVPLVAHAAVCIYVVGGMVGAGIADSVYSHESSLAEAAAAEPILVEATLRWDQGTAGLGNRAVDFIARTLSAAAID